MARSASNPDQEYIYFKGSETLPSACYDESSIPFYSTSNGYKNVSQKFSSSTCPYHLKLLLQRTDTIKVFKSNGSRMLQDEWSK